MTQWRYPFFCTLHYPIIIIMQTYLCVLHFINACQEVHFVECQSSQLSQSSSVQYMGLWVFSLPIILQWLGIRVLYILLSSTNRMYDPFTFVLGKVMRQWYTLHVFLYSKLIDNPRPYHPSCLRQSSYASAAWNLARQSNHTVYKAVNYLSRQKYLKTAANIEYFLSKINRRITSLSSWINNGLKNSIFVELSKVGYRWWLDAIAFASSGN